MVFNLYEGLGLSSWPWSWLWLWLCPPAPSWNIIFWDPTTTYPNFWTKLFISDFIFFPRDSRTSHSAINIIVRTSNTEQVSFRMIHNIVGVPSNPAISDPVSCFDEFWCKVFLGTPRKKIKDWRTCNLWIRTRAGKSKSLIRWKRRKGGKRRKRRKRRI